MLQKVNDWQINKKILYQINFKRQNAWFWATKQAIISRIITLVITCKFYVLINATH